MNNMSVYDKIYHFLLVNSDTSNSIQNICRHAKCDKRTANRCLYDMLKNGLVLKTKEKRPPSWQYKSTKVKID